MRFYGVLQRIAICYLVVGLFYIWDQRVSTKVVALVVSLVGYWVLIRWVPVPGAGMPGRDIPFMDIRNNLVSWLDRLVMPHHLYLEWGGPDPHNTRDPEGLLSDLPAFGTCLLGVLTGYGCADSGLRSTLGGLAAAAVGCLAAGIFVVDGVSAEQEHVDEHLCAGGGGLLAYGADPFVLGDGCVGWGRGEGSKWLVYPLLVLGSNAITAYMFSEIVPGILDRIHFTADGRLTNPMAWLADHVFIHMPTPGWAAFAFSFFDAGVLLYTGVDHVSEEDLREGVVHGTGKKRRQKIGFCRRSVSRPSVALHLGRRAGVEA